MVDVVLVADTDGEDLDRRGGRRDSGTGAGEAPDEGVPEPGGPGRPARLTAQQSALGGLFRRHPRTTVWGTVLLLVVVGTATVVDARRESLRREHWAHLDTVALPLDDAVRELWRVERDDERVILLERDLYLTASASDILHAVDADSGRPRWATALPGAATAQTAPACVAPDTDLPVLVCWSGTTGGRADLVVLGTGDGLERARWPLEADPIVLVADGSDVVLAVPTADRGTEVSRVDPLTGDLRWTHHVPPGAPGADDDVDLGFTPGFFARVEDGALFAVGELDLAILLSTGELLPWAMEQAQVTTNVERLADDGWVTGPGIPTGEPGQAFDSDGSLRFVFDGTPLELDVDDGSRPDVLLVRSWPDLMALDARTGAVQWTVRGACGEGNPVIRLEGSLVCALEAGGEGVVSRIDIATGRDVWSRRTGQAAGMSVVTDGDRVVVLGGGGGRQAARSYALADGTPGWESFVPADVRTLFVEDRRLYGAGDGVVVRLG